MTAGLEIMRTKPDEQDQNSALFEILQRAFCASVEAKHLIFSTKSHMISVTHLLTFNLSPRNGAVLLLVTKTIKIEFSQRLKLKKVIET